MEQTAITPEVGAVVGVVFIIICVLLGLILGLVLTVLPFWKICSKAGFPGPLSLLMLVPIGNIILPFYVAFAEWPALKNKT